MDYKPNDIICNCKQVSYVDIDRALHSHKTFSDVEKEFEEVEKIFNRELVILFDSFGGIQ